MITLFIYGLIAISLASAVAYGYVNFAHSARQLTFIQDNQRRIDAAATAVRASLLPLNGDGVLYPPAGILGVAPNAYTQLSLGNGVVAATPWGQPYLYCPLSPTGTANRLTGNADTVVSPTAPPYAITTYPAVQNQNVAYVITSPTVVAANTAANIDNQGYVAFIVSPLAPRGATLLPMPNCGDVTITPGGLAVANGLVVGVTGGFTYPQRNNFSKTRMELYVGGAATGDSTGRDINNLTTIDNALALWKSLEPRLTMIYLTTNVTTTNDLNAEDGRRITLAGGVLGSVAQGENTSLVISPVPGAAAVTLTLSGQVTITSNVTFQNLTVVDFAAAPAITVYKPFSLKQSTLVLNSQSPAISVYNSAINITDTALAGGGNFATISGANSSLNFLETVNTLGANAYNNIGLSGSLMNVNFDSTIANANMKFTGAGGGLVVSLFSFTASNINIGKNVTVTAVTMPTPLVVLKASKFNVSGYLFNNGGALINDVQLLAGSTMTVLPSAGAGTNFIGGIYAEGSKLAINAPITMTSGIGAGEATVTGTSNFTSLSNNCFNIYRNGVATTQSPIQKGAASQGSPLAHYKDSQYSLPPLYNYGTASVTTTITNTPQPINIADATTITLGNINNPYMIYDSSATNYYLADSPVGTVPNQTPGIQAQAFEAGVRNIINYGFRPVLTNSPEFMYGGLHLSLFGNCT